ncbi:uncharacterized protein lrfn4b, partial [Tachysurus ichikawai]
MGGLRLRRTSWNLWLSAQSVSIRCPSGFPALFSTYPQVAHKSVDLFTGLPLSARHTTILSVVDWFSKMAHFVTLHKLLSTKEISLLLLQHMFCRHRLPRNIVQGEAPVYL